MNDTGEFIGGALIIALFVAVVFGLAGLFTMLLWNCLMPVIFALPKITFWQAIGVWLLSTILFGGRTVRYSKE